MSSQEKKSGLGVLFWITSAAVLVVSFVFFTTLARDVDGAAYWVVGLVYSGAVYVVVDYVWRRTGKPQWPWRD